MVKFQSGFLILFFLVPLFIFSQEDPYVGVWQVQSSRKLITDSFLAIQKCDDNTYFVLHVDYFNNHQHDYATYGKLNEDGQIEIKTDISCFYIELDEYGYLYHLWTKDDFDPPIFERVVDKATMEARDKKPEITLEQFDEFMKYQEGLSE